MGGNAFNQTLSSAIFPRMSPECYQTLKAALLPYVQPLYELVAVPNEAPGKADHGDIDFVVAHPKPGTSLELVRQALKATHSLLQEGNRTSNFAVSTTAFDHVYRASEHGRDDFETFYQVDVSVCADKGEWERTVFLHSYGDLGMILSVLARAAGLSLSVHGLKLLAPLPTSPPVTFYLSFSLSQILEFFGLSQDRWTEGFATEQEIFEWIASSVLFRPHTVAPADNGHTAGRNGRKVRFMYQNFLAYARDLAHARPAAAQPSVVVSLSEGVARSPIRAGITADDALRFFRKEAEHAALIRSSDIKQHAREVFSGKLLEGWTGMRGLPVKWLMDTARERLEQAHAQTRPEDYRKDVSQTVIFGHDLLGKEPFVVSSWELALWSMSMSEVRSFILQIQDDMTRAGTCERNWEKERSRKAKKQVL
ncbi:uncharacterized protein FIBRA_03947 [Fibroporia radiculosa]|uniref:Uncharacterized protein n=1 Tax=Fibroporia radiculosa TaxID=599839 RepID=J4I9W6_9APHY|nr:uncharacterized protein FIBRA_03947 [Fibroporia radiculosa]CCM01876.1 predicted protein [Fibroporia radiculosa]